MAAMPNDATRWERTGEQAFEGALSERWANGPGAYGGIVAATVLHQMQRVLDDSSKRVRTLHLHMCAPVRFDAATLTVRTDRLGMSISHLGARIEQGGDVPVAASATFADEHPEGPEFERLERPEAPPPEEVEVVPKTGLMPTYAAEFFEFRYCLGAFPLSGVDEAETGGWLSTREPMNDGALLAACLLDVWPPSITATYERFRQTVTVDLRYQFCSAPEREGTTDEPFLFFAHTDVAGSALAQEDSALWSREGELVGRAQQLYRILD